MNVTEEIIGNEITRTRAGYVTWRAPVNAFPELPMQGNSPGDARVVLDEDRPYLWDEETQTWIPFGAGSLHGETHTSEGPDPVPAATEFFDGLMSVPDKLKLDTIEEGAQVNYLDEQQAAELVSHESTDLHNHDHRYYTKEEIDLMLGQMA